VDQYLSIVNNGSIVILAVIYGDKIDAFRIITGEINKYNG
jgi:hypothetical protein